MRDAQALGRRKRCRPISPAPHPGYVAADQKGRAMMFTIEFFRIRQRDQVASKVSAVHG